MTPSGTIFDEPVESVIVPGSEGFFGVLSNHAPIVSTLTRGVVSLKKENQEKYFVIDSGVLEMDHQNHCLLLSDNAEEALNFDEATAKVAGIKA